MAQNTKSAQITVTAEDFIEWLRPFFESEITGKWYMLNLYYAMISLRKHPKSFALTASMAREVKHALTADVSQSAEAELIDHSADCVMLIGSLPDNEVVLLYSYLDEVRAHLAECGDSPEFFLRQIFAVKTKLLCETVTNPELLDDKLLSTLAQSCVTNYPMFVLPIPRAQAADAAAQIGEYYTDRGFEVEVKNDGSWGYSVKGIGTVGGKKKEVGVLLTHTFFPADPNADSPILVSVK